MSTMLHSDPLSRVNWPLNGARVTRVGTRAANELSQSQRIIADTDAIIIRWVKVPLAWCLNTVLNVKTLVGEGSFAALARTVTLVTRGWVWRHWDSWGPEEVWINCA